MGFPRKLAFYEFSRILRVFSLELQKSLFSFTDKEEANLISQKKMTKRQSSETIHEDPSKKIQKVKNMKKKESEEMKIQYFDSVPNELEIIILSFVISEMKKDWKGNWKNVSLVSKHWNSIAWIFFQRTISPSEKETIFFQGCYKGWFHFINKFLTQDTTFDPSTEHCSRHAIGHASKFGNVDIVKLLLQDKRVDPSVDDNYAIIKASKYGRIDIVNLLLQDKRVDPSAQENEAFLSAILQRETNIVQILLQDKRVDPSAKNNFAIGAASNCGYYDIVKILLQDQRVDPSDDNNYAFLAASENGEIEIVKLLLQDERIVSSTLDLTDVDTEIQFLIRMRNF